MVLQTIGLKGGFADNRVKGWFCKKNKQNRIVKLEFNLKEKLKTIFKTKT